MHRGHQTLSLDVLSLADGRQRNGIYSCIPAPKCQTVRSVNSGELSLWRSANRQGLQNEDLGMKTKHSINANIIVKTDNRSA